MENTDRKYSYGYGLLAIVFGAILAGFGVFEGRGFSIFGFFVFLIAFLNLLDKATLFKENKHDFWRLLTYVAGLAVVLYIFYPYSGHKAALRPLWQRWYVEVLAAAGYVPALILKGLRHFFDVPVSYSLTEARTHYPLAVGFWLFWLLLTITLQLYNKVSQRTPSPMLYLMLGYNFAIGIMIVVWFPLMGIMMTGVSAAAWAYMFFPRSGTPTGSKAKRWQRKVRKADKKIKPEVN